MARDAFATFIPLSVESDARTKIIFDFFDLMAAIAAHGKTNGMGGRKMSRLAGWWAFEQFDVGNGFDGGYKSWSRYVFCWASWAQRLTCRSAADATSHLFFAYLRSLSPDSVRGLNGISALPTSLQNLVNETQYPPDYPTYEATSKVVMVVNSVSPTPFALLRRAKNFEYRDDDRTLQEFSNFEDPVQALTDECRRVLKNISSANQSAASTTKASTSLGDSSWSRFEDMGFGSLGDLDEDEHDSALGKKRNGPQAMRSAPYTRTNDSGRPTTPSWADFLSSGFVEEINIPAPAPLFLPPDKILPPIDIDRRGQSSQSHKRRIDDSDLEPGELASINAIELDDAFWWVWITSLAGEETPARKATFGRCALIETNIGGGTWLVVEEMVKGAAPEPDAGAYIAEKKSRFTFRNRNKMTRTKSTGRKTPPPGSVQPFIRENQAIPPSKTNIGPDQHARIQAAAAVLQQKQRQQENGQGPFKTSSRRGRQGDAQSTKTNSVFTLQPVIMSEASPAMKWANDYDKKEIRAKYLGSNFAGKGYTTDLDTPRGYDNGTQGSVTPQPARAGAAVPDYGFPKQLSREDSGVDTNRTLPALPVETPGERTLQAPTGPPPAVPAPPAPLPVAPQMPMGPPPPAPFPVEPQAHAGSNAVVADAAEVPLPAATPMAPTDKPLPSFDGEELEPTRTITNTQTNGVESPESTKGGKKLKKQQGGGGFKGFFGKKKGPALPTQSAPADSAAVAAARAAYQGPEMKPNYQPAISLSRRVSGIGRRKTPPTSTPATPPIPDAEEPLPARPAPFKDEYPSQARLSRVDSSEQRHADQEFKTFDQPHYQFNQGPMDQPAFVPQDTEGSPRPSFVPDHSDAPSRPSTTGEAHGPHFEPPLGRGQYAPSMPSEERPRTPSPPADRWAQIRKNAAERANRVSEDPRTRMSQDKTEDGEESGEESKSSTKGSDSGMEANAEQPSNLASPALKLESQS